ncbi:hypothetical protein [Pseudomarimonas salicorniae]|uniref:Cytochrome c domain-containing protein n=1 Tax=Pseudomarimonas salicorniae TaxID=2933270 RepID=A0ABT0GF17_9GAMM|nr:hypothetical protein [Lysobacter sp. CAU 1642]MCK7593023.1 hypothetical protein [Lysobacter sp. CAU 1642]
MFDIDDAVDFDRDVAPIFASRCTSCHAGASALGGLRLDNEFAHGASVRVRSSGSPDLLRVEPFNPAASLLWLKLNCDQPPSGSRMPLGMPALSPGERRAIFSWISRGAPAGLGGSSQFTSVDSTISGTWFDPSAPGQGIFLEVIQADPPGLLLNWATFAPETVVESGNRIVEHEKRWYVGIGELDPARGSANVGVFESSGGLFDSGALAASDSPVGTAEVYFHSCNSASLIYDIELPVGEERRRFARSIALNRLSPSPTCEAGRINVPPPANPL